MQILLFIFALPMAGCVLWNEVVFSDEQRFMGASVHVVERLKKV
jgi:predicted membrane protein